MLKALSSIPGTQLSLSEVGFQLGSFLPHRDAEPNAILLNIDSHHSSFEGQILYDFNCVIFSCLNVCMCVLMIPSPSDCTFSR